MKTPIAVFFTIALILVPYGPTLDRLQTVYAYPPGVGILTASKNCLSCHSNNGPWTTESNTIIDIIERDSKKSFRQPDGTFLLQVKRNALLTVQTITGYKKNDKGPAPYRNGWIYIDTSTIESSAISKFAPGWDVNLQMACRIVGDKLEGYEEFNLTVLPMTIRPSDAARDAQVTLQLMLTRGEAVKGKGKEGMIGNYFERKVILKVID